jgi:hypothetical protein
VTADEGVIKKPPPKIKPQKAKPEIHRFRVTIRSGATVDVESEVEAKTAKESGELALGKVRNEGVDLSTGKLSQKVLRVHRV